MELRTKRLVLREFTLDDCAVVHAYQSKPAYMRHYDFDERTVADVEAFVAMLVGWSAERPRAKYQLAITLDGAVIGCTGVRCAAPGDDEAEFGCELDPAYWGNGYAREAAEAVLAFGFETLGLRLAWAQTVPENAAAVKLATALGMRRSGDRFVLPKA